MPEENSGELERYKALLRRQELNWQARFESMLESDKAALAIGLVALRTAVLINAGAVVALLAFVGQLWRDGGDTLAGVLAGMLPFVYGLVAAGAAAGVAYFYQSFMTVLEQRALAEVSQDAQDLKPLKWFPALAKWSGRIMMFAGLASYALFIWGALDIISVLGR